MSSQEPLATLSESIKNLESLRYCAGTLPWDTKLFYDLNEEESRSLKFPPANNSHLDSLFSACQPVGINPEDELNSKARKIDASSFSVLFSPYEGLVGLLAEVLLHGRFKAEDITIKLAELDVCGPGGFSKTLADTRRDSSTIASLLVVLPTVHDGGSHTIRQDGKEWTFDPSKVVSTALSAPKAAFIAFFSDVKHEMKPITSGYQVTLIYDVCVGKDNDGTVSAVHPGSDELVDALTCVLKDPDCFPDGGFIGFRLSHKYPFEVADSYWDSSPTFADIKETLKGSDAVIKRVCDSLSLSVSMKAVYFVDENQEEEGMAVLLHQPFHMEYRVDGSLLNHFESCCKGKVVQDHEEHGDWDDEYTPIVWAGPFEASTNTYTFRYLNEHHKWPVMHEEGIICLIADIPPVSERID